MVQGKHSSPCRFSPYVKQEQIDKDLNAYLEPKVTIDKLGTVKFGRQKRKFGRIGGKTLVATGKRVPLAALIIAARASGHYQGNPRWKLDKNPFKDVSRVAGRSAMARLTTKLLKGRHSSTSFIRSGFVAAIVILRDFVIRRMSGPKPDSQATGQSYGPGKFGDATPAKDNGTGKAFAQIVNNIGAEGFDAAKVNQVMIDKESGPLQESIDEEAKSMWEYIATHQNEANARFNQATK